MIIRYSYRKKTGYKNNNNIDNNVKMLVLIMITLLMSFSHLLFCWYFNTVLLSVVSVVAAGQSQKVRVLISRFSASYLDTFLHIHVCFFLYKKKTPEGFQKKKHQVQSAQFVFLFVQLNLCYCEHV